MNYFIPQIDNSDCGFACLKMMVAHLYKDEKALYIKQNENHGPYNFYELKEKGKEYGIELEGVEIGVKPSIKEMRLPLIALLKKKNDLFHYVLVTKVKGGFVRYLDPEDGPCICSNKSFFSMWTGTALIIQDFTKDDGIMFTTDDIHRKSSNIIVTVFQIISAVMLGVGIYFIDEQTKIFIPILFLALSLVAEILLRIILIRKMEKFDDEYMTGISVDKKEFYTFYERLEDYKRKSITQRMNIVFSFVIIIFLSVIVLMNNIYNAFLVLIPLFLSIVDTKFVMSSIRGKDELIGLEESEIKSLKTIDTFKSQVNKLHQRGYKLARLTLIKKYVFLAILMVVALLTTVFNETFSLPYVIFYFAIGYTIFEQFENFLLYPIKEKELLRSKIRLYNITNRI